MPSRPAPLRVPGFARLGASYTVNQLGDWLGAVALAVLVFDRTGSALATAALFLAAKFLPAFLAPVLTARIDQLATGRALAGLYVAEGAIFGLLALVSHAFSLPLVLALALVDGTLALGARALTRAAVAAVLAPAGALRAGNALINVGSAISTAVGPLLAGGVVAGAGVRTALLIDGASFLLMAAVVAGGALPGGAPARQAWRERVRAGLAYVGRHPFLRAVLLAEAAALVFFATVVPIEVVYAKDTLGAGDAGYGALLAAWGGGMVLGSLVFTRAAQRSSLLLIALSTAAVALSYLGLAGAGSLLLACAISVPGGMGNGIQWVAVLTSVQEATPADYQARVVGLLESLAAAMLGAGFLLGGVVTSLASPRLAYAVAGGGALGVLALAAPLARRGGAPENSQGAGDAASPLRDATSPGERIGAP